MSTIYRKFTPSQKEQIRERSKNAKGRPGSYPNPPHHQYFIGRLRRPLQTKQLRWLMAAFFCPRHNECVDWPFSCRENGYPQIFIGGMRTTAHRVTCVWEHGPPDQPKLHAAHNCGNKKCCNPSHLRWATPKENIADKHRHGTHRQGEQIHASKLTQRDVLSIRHKLQRGHTLCEIASAFGITFQTVSDIKRRKIWKHVP